MRAQMRVLSLACARPRVPNGTALITDHAAALLPSLQVTYHPRVQIGDRRGIRPLFFPFSYGVLGRNLNHSFMALTGSITVRGKKKEAKTYPSYWVLW